MPRGNSMKPYLQSLESQVDRGAYIPTQEEIREGCLRIQETWSKRDEQARAGAGASTGAVELMEMADPKLGKSRTYLKGD